MGEESEKMKAGAAARLVEVLAVSTKLGLTSFGGPAAHLGYFHEEYVKRRGWLNEQSYASLVALCQFLPGPASSQVGIGIGVLRAGFWGGILAWIGFTLPSVVALVVFALVLQGLDVGSQGWVHGLKITAAAIIAYTVADMGRKLAPDRIRATLAVLAAVAVSLWTAVYAQVLIIVLAGIGGFLLLKEASGQPAPAWQVSISRRFGAICLLLFLLLLFGLPLLRSLYGYDWLALADSFYRSGSLVFGGGHVVLPLLEREVVPAGWVSGDDFLTGYGAAQAVPGPLFTFAAYLGALSDGLAGALLATAAIFLPAFLLVLGALPFWSSLQSRHWAQAALKGVNAAVVGLLLAALYDPIWTSAIQGRADFALGVVLFAMLAFWKLPPWVVVLAGAAGGMFIS